MPVPVVIAGIAIGTLVIAFKEVADFVQIGLVSWQTAKRFKEQRAIRGGTVGIDGGTVTVQIGDLRAVLPIEDAAALAGVGGAGGRGKRPEIGARAGRPVPPGGWGATAPVDEGPLKGADVQLSRPGPGQDTTTGAPRPAADARPFSLREYIVLQQAAAEKGGLRKDTRERDLAALRAQHDDRLALLDAQIARERIAAQVDIVRLQVVTRLEEQRRELISRFELQERELASRLELQRERGEIDAASQERKFELQEGAAEAERRWKTEERKADLNWRERTQKEQSEIADYRMNLAADLSVGRAVDAAVKLGEALKRHGLAPAGLVSFAQAWARR